MFGAKMGAVDFTAKSFSSGLEAIPWIGAGASHLFDAEVSTFKRMQFGPRLQAIDTVGARVAQLAELGIDVDDETIKQQVNMFTKRNEASMMGQRRTADIGLADVDIMDALKKQMQRYADVKETMRTGLGRLW